MSPEILNPEFKVGPCNPKTVQVCLVYDFLPNPDSFLPAVFWVCDPMVHKWRTSLHGSPTDGGRRLPHRQRKSISWWVMYYSLENVNFLTQKNILTSSTLYWGGWEWHDWRPGRFARDRVEQMPVGTSITRWTSTIVWSMSGKKTLLPPYLWPSFTGILFLVAEFVNHSLMNINVPGVVVVYKRLGIRLIPF